MRTRLSSASLVMNIFVALACVGSASVVAGAITGCSGDDGEQGPAGVAGAPGASGTGSPGAAGTAGAVGQPGQPGKDAVVPTPVTEAPKAVYTLSNDATSNAIFVYSRGADGTLTPKDAYATGGIGAGAGLGDQGALVFDATRKMFFAINNGDNSISMLALELDGSLSLKSKIKSGGVKPVSVTVAGDLVYVVNAGDAGTASNISGFKIESAGLTRIPSSTQPLSAALPAPAQIQFTPDGKQLVVTEKGTNKIDTYVVSAEGVAGAPKSQAAAGQTPFGFAFSGNNLIVSEAFGGGAGLGATSSYTMDAQGMITAKSSSVANLQSAPCWVAISGGHAYVTNTGSKSVTSYAVTADGVITLADASGVSGMTGMSPTDVDASDDNAFLYTLNSGDHTMTILSIAADGKLTSKATFTGIPETAVGLVAR